MIFFLFTLPWRGRVGPQGRGGVKFEVDEPVAIGVT
jgi:hypothetical protein